MNDMNDIKFITEPDETGLGRIIINGRFYGVPATPIAILVQERERNRAAIAHWQTKYERERNLYDALDIDRGQSIAELVGALKGVVRVADRQTDEFDMARALITKYGD